MRDFTNKRQMLVGLLKRPCFFNIFQPFTESNQNVYFTNKKQNFCPMSWCTCFIPHVPLLHCPFFHWQYIFWPYGLTFGKFSLMHGRVKLNAIHFDSPVCIPVHGYAPLVSLPNGGTHGNLWKVPCYGFNFYWTMKSPARL